MEKGYYRKYAIIGPGGRRCGCCYPPPGHKRRSAERLFKKRERRFFASLIDKELNEL